MLSIYSAKTAPKTCHRPTGQVLVASEEMAQEAGAFWAGGTFGPPEMRQVVAKMELYQSNNMPRIYMTKLIGCLFLD